MVTLQELTLSMAHMLKIALLGGFENDAAGCHDRILMNMPGDFKKVSCSM
jgi:hypothetical protein